MLLHQFLPDSVQPQSQHLEEYTTDNTNSNSIKTVDNNYIGTQTLTAS